MWAELKTLKEKVIKKDLDVKEKLCTECEKSRAALLERDKLQN